MDANSLERCEKTVNVTNGTSKIAFYQAAPGSTNLQIDDVQLMKLTLSAT